MPPKTNPLKLNNLQLKTLTLLQLIAAQPEFAEAHPETGEMTIRRLPHAHGDHFHIGQNAFMTRDASGLDNPAVWVALTRKGLVRTHTDGSYGLTEAGMSYHTGMREMLIHGSPH
jgi:hypothetical protein